MFLLHPNIVVHVYELVGLFFHVGGPQSRTNLATEGLAAFEGTILRLDGMVDVGKFLAVRLVIIADVSWQLFIPQGGTSL